MSQKNIVYQYYLLYFMKEIRHNSNQLVSIADGERKDGREQKRGAAKTRKLCAFKDSVS